MKNKPRKQSKALTKNIGNDKILPVNHIYNRKAAFALIAAFSFTLLMSLSSVSTVYAQNLNLPTVRDSFVGQIITWLVDFTAWIGVVILLFSGVMFAASLKSNDANNRIQSIWGIAAGSIIIALGIALPNLLPGATP